MSTISERFLLSLPSSDRGAVVCLSGGLDSTTALRLSVEKYGADNVDAISFDYGQKQSLELTLAGDTCQNLGVRHKVFKLDFLNQINQGFSANVDADIEMPTIQDVLGDPQPVTYVANRNMILMSIVAAYAETKGRQWIISGLQSNDEYNYWDTTKAFIHHMNEVFDLNRKADIQLLAPFAGFNKKEEIEVILELDGNLDLFKNTITCYNPDVDGRSCGNCPSCSERLAAFKKLGLKDPVEYI